MVEVKTSHFFACLDRLRLIQRWSLMRNIEKENLAEHSLQVAFVAQALAIIKNRFFGGEVNPERIAVMAMYHELEHGNHEFKTAKKRLENLMEQWHSQEMDYFLQVFLPSFGCSIDEIAL
ncbi:MAG: YfbR-like 5'-deoxynucleotidase [Haemophilus parainfluenzae]|nr:YfbR-like 5'-deoxynucleotidase [Haemophilus parainfluenzae]